MAKTTKLTQQDLQIYQSERLTDTPDGGGLMRGIPLTGADNELFSPVSDVDRTMGAFNVRKVFPAVLRNDTEPLYGAHTILSERPHADHVSFLLFAAGIYGEERKDILPRIEAYSVPTFESRMTLLGTQLSGSRMVQVYQRVEAELPVIGERYCLVEERKNQEPIVEYFRILNFTHEVRTFEDVTNNKEFQRRVIKLETSSALRRDFKGVEYPKQGYHNANVKVLETQVADTAQYYGCKYPVKAIHKQDGTIDVGDVFEKIVPTSLVETAYADQYPVGATLWLPTAPEGVVLRPNRNIKGDLYLNTSVLPGSIKIDNFSDDAMGKLHHLSSDVIVDVDYANGVIKGLNNQYISSITATPATLFAGVNYTAMIQIDETNQGTEWAPFLNPQPASGSVVVSFMSQGQWYELRDYGDNKLKDKDGTVRGNIERTGSVIISLPEQPDVGSKIVIAWNPVNFYKTIDGQEVGKVITPVEQTTKMALLKELIPNIKPNTVQLISNDAVIAQDNGQGQITGSVTGTVDYAIGQIYLQNSTVNQIKVKLKRYTQPSSIQNIETKLASNVLSGTMGKALAGSVKIGLNIAYQVNINQDVRMVVKTPQLFTSTVYTG